MLALQAQEQTAFANFAPWQSIQYYDRAQIETTCSLVENVLREQKEGQDLMMLLQDRSTSQPQPSEFETLLGSRSV